MTEEQLKRIFAKNLKQLLESRNYTQETFIEAFNKQYDTQFTRVSVSTWINHKKMPRPIVVQQIGEFFGHDAGYMLSDHNTKHGPSDRSTRYTACDYFGIDPEAIERADRIVENTLKQYHLEDWSEQVHNNARFTLQDHLVNASVTSTIIWSLFDELKELLECRLEMDEDRIEKIIDGKNSKFCVDGKEIGV